MNAMTKLVVAVLVACPGLPGLAMSAAPPPLLNYQGVLRNAADRPLTGTYDMTFRFFSDATGGDEILVDFHPAVAVSRGQFAVQLGGGTVSDGSGLGVYVELPNVFGDYSTVYLQVEVSGEVLSPRTQVLSSAYSLSARYVNGVDVASSGILDLYVNAATGNDSNNGLTPSSPKRTIQAAVDRIPGVLNGDVTIHIAPGTYAETVILSQRVCLHDEEITFRGEPEAEITGSGLRGTGLTLSYAAGVVLENLWVHDTTFYDVASYHTSTTVRGCRFGDAPGLGAGGGLSISGGRAVVENTRSARHNNDGIICTQGAFCELNNVILSENSSGVTASRAAIIRFQGPATITYNRHAGVHVYQAGFANFLDRSDVTVTDNSPYDLRAKTHSAIWQYQYSSVGSCVADSYGICEPGGL